ncbi:MAG: ethanolamine ammonia-lyase subunit EutB [Deltaproteobacteria bacterium]|nr:ethanolamine ammonia-lyase subunit EutB [Deltaproteobacteria bacterium]
MKRITILGSLLFLLLFSLAVPGRAVTIDGVKPGEDVFSYIERIKGKFDQTLYCQVMGAANAFKEGDATLGVAADNDTTRVYARMLLANTKIKDVHEHPLYVDGLQKLVWDNIDQAQYAKVKEMTLGELKEFLLTRSEAEIKGIMEGLDSDVIACMPKLMSNAELITVGQKVFNPLPGSKLGAKGYLAARVQPNSPTDNVDDIQWQVFNAFSFAVGDLILGTNPVDSSVDSVAAVENALADILKTFKIENNMPWCVLAHIDVQAKVEKKYPGSTAIFFQSLAGCDQANATFGLTNQKLLDYARSRKGQRYGLYFETGQGADFTNGAGNGFDMVVHESRKYGLARVLKHELAKVQPHGAWIHLNDVAGFIGPEVFTSREQLVRCCLEDIVMGKLHGLCHGLDICSTLHMTVSLDDLEWCQDQIAPANPGYLMALPTRNDPMLSYLTTSFQDHVRLREKFGFKVNDAMWEFFKKIKIIDQNGKFTEHAGDPIWVYYQYCLAKGDRRSKDEIYAEGKKKVKEVVARGVDLAIGHGKKVSDIEPELDKTIHALYDDAKVSLWSEFTPEFIKTIPHAVVIKTKAKDREDYIAHPASGEQLSETAVATLEKLRQAWGSKIPDVQIVISDGLNAKAIMDEGHLLPYLQALEKELRAAGMTVSTKNLVVINGRVRAGYQIGEVLFAQADAAKPKTILHIIGERPGSGHHNFSVYIASPKGKTWQEKKVDHDIVRVISGISNTALKPEKAAAETVRLIKKINAR